MSRFGKFVHELQERRVFRIASIYVVTMWIVVQGALDLFPVFGIPNWGARLVVIIGVLGLPVAIALSWAFQVTPDGIVRDHESDGEPDEGSTKPRMDFVVIAALLVLGVFLLIRANFDLITAEPERSLMALDAPPNSVAVLPFENFSDDENTGYFSDGLSEEVLNVLASIPGMKVASRTSSFSFKKSDAKIPDIATELNVSYVLEGSVRKSAEKVRVTAQLINARTDVHEWSQTFDRELKDIFAIQDEIAGAIATRLRPTVMATRGGGSTMPRRPPATTNMEAYDLYLRGLAKLRSEDDASRDEGMRLLEQSLELDPQFRRAAAALAAAREPEKSPASQ